ncbi:MAG: NAD-dependent epimerase/dehydratase family protein, partial [Caldilineaceae bacterium]|nr:NAD-dependent epimerase/dehydratase family protein [Caldilineaceae bacterium]
GINKMAGEWYHILYNNVYGIRACALRLTNTYGPRMRVKDARQTFLGIWIKQLIDGQAIQVWGDGRQLRDFTYVDDCVEALLLAAASPSADGQIFNLGSAEIISLRDLAALMVEMYGQGRFEIIPYPADRKPIDIGDYYGDYGLIRDRLGWQPQIMLREGLARSLAYYADPDHQKAYW